MRHAISHAEISNFVSADYYNTTAKTKVNVFSKFMTWCKAQEENRMMWLVMTYLGQIGLALPCTLAAILFLGGNNFNLWIIACVINVPVLAINLAAQPTKITLPALFFSWTADAIIMLYCAVYFYTHL